MCLKNKHPQLLVIPKKPKCGRFKQRKLFFLNDKLKNIERYDFVVEAIGICVILLHNYERNN